MIYYVTGSRKFYKNVDELVLKLSLEGNTVLSFCTYIPEAWDRLSPEQKGKIQLSQLHKIDIADEIHVVNLDGYIGTTVEQEIAYTIFKGKKLRFTDKTLGELYLEKFSHEIGKLVSSHMYPGRNTRM